MNINKRETLNDRAKIYRSKSTTGTTVSLPPIWSRRNRDVDFVKVSIIPGTEVLIVEPIMEDTESPSEGAD